mgnify:FL=1
MHLFFKYFLPNILILYIINSKMNGKGVCDQFWSLAPFLCLYQKWRNQMEINKYALFADIADTLNFTKSGGNIKINGN